jgi:hypothetical protein
MAQKVDGILILEYDDSYQKSLDPKYSMLIGKIPTFHKPLPLQWNKLDYESEGGCRARNYR